MNIKEIYRIWEKSGFKDRDMQKAFNRACTSENVAELIKELKENKRDSF